ncbi:hypothetical protein D3C71_1626560 [compost metagenome]
MAQHAGRVAHQGQRLAGRKGFFDQRNGLCILRQVPQRPVTAGVEHGVKVIGLHAGQQHGAGQFFLRGQIALETASGICLRISVIAFGVQRRLAAFRGCERDVCARVFEDVIRGGKFFQPETGLLTGVSQLVVGGQNHEDAGHTNRFR